MRRMLLIIGLLYFSINGFSQTTIDSSTSKAGKDSVVLRSGCTNTLPAPYDYSEMLDSTAIFTKVEQNATVPPNWSDYLNQHMNTSVGFDNGADAGLYKVVVEFVVGKDGSVNYIHAITNYGYGMEDEAIKMMKHSPDWIPARQNGRIVKAFCFYTFTFNVAVQ